MSTSEQQLVTMMENIPAKTGKPLAEWKTIISQSNVSKHGEIVKFLKSNHGVTHGFANLIAAKTLESGEDIDLVAEQYSGAKASLLPLYEEVLKFVQSLGTDVEVAPKKASVSLRRKKQFALVIPATKSRLDLGLALKGEEPQDRLETYNAMCSHRVKLESSEDFDQQIRDWIKLAYTRSG